MAEQSWYEWFFSKRYMQARGPTLMRADIAQEVNFLLTQVGLDPGMRVLDLGCGNGRHAVQLARRGLDVVGLDLSEYLLQLADQAATNAGVSVDFVRRDMREIEWEDHFDGIINMFTAFGFFADDDENFKVLEGVARALKPGGRFCIDVISYVWLLRNWECASWSAGHDDTISLEDRSMNWKKGMHLSSRTIVEPDGKRWNMTHSLRVFPPHELVRWVEKAGMEVEGLYGNFGGKPFDPDSRRLIVIARKAG